MNLIAHLRKMRADNGTPIKYWLSTKTGEILLNEFIGRYITLDYLGQINCWVCNRLTK